MALTIAKIAPTAVVLAAVGYCSWPYMDQKSPGLVQPEASKLPEISMAQLNPEIVLNTKRDPFGNTVPVQMGKTRDKDEKKDKGKAKDTPGTGKGKADGKNDKAVTPPRPVLNIDTTKMTLNATLLRGERHVAVINSQSYGEGEKLVDPEHPGHPITISKVFTNHVQLQRDGKTVELFSARLFENEELPAASGAGGGLFNFFSSGTKAAPTAPPRKSTSYVRLSRPLPKKGAIAQPSSMKAAPARP